MPTWINPRSGVVMPITVDDAMSTIRELTQRCEYFLSRADQNAGISPEDAEVVRASFAEAERLQDEIAAEEGKLYPEPTFNTSRDRHVYTPPAPAQPPANVTPRAPASIHDEARAQRLRDAAAMIDALGQDDHDETEHSSDHPMNSDPPEQQHKDRKVVHIHRDAGANQWTVEGQGPLLIVGTQAAAESEANRRLGLL